MYRVGQVGSFVRIPQGYQDLYGVVAAVGAHALLGSGGEDDVEHYPPYGGQLGIDVGEQQWMMVELVGEMSGGAFERGINQYPNVGDFVHLAIESDLKRIYEFRGHGHVSIGTLSSAESIPAKIGLNELVTRHSAVLGSTGSGKSTTISSLLRTITSSGEQGKPYPGARVMVLDVHGEYSVPLGDVAEVFSVDPQGQQRKLNIPYWALDTGDLLDFLTGKLDENREAAFTDKIFELKLASHDTQQFRGLSDSSITADTPIPFSLQRLWYDLMNFEVMTFEGPARDHPAILDAGDPKTLTAPRYKRHGLGSTGPFLNQQALGILRPLNLLRSRMLDRRYHFLLEPGPWDPDLNGDSEEDLDTLLHGWLGNDKPITILDLSGVPSTILPQLVGSILKIVYEALFWSREHPEGGVKRPLLVVMEEAHRYLSTSDYGLASEVTQRIAKEGRKYGVGAMVISQRPSEVDETVLSQCGTFFAMRLSNPEDRARVRSTLPDGLSGLLDVLPILRTGEAIVSGEAAKLPMRCRVTLPSPEHRPHSEDPRVSERWSSERRGEDYSRMVESWRAQRPRGVLRSD